MLAALLPVLVSALQMQAPLTDAEVEHALADGVRERLSHGWTLVDIDGDYEEITLTLTKGGKVEQHVAHIDHDAGNAYRVDVGGALPTTKRVPELAVQALFLGGLEIGGDCGRLEARFFILDASAQGAAAGRLVARTLWASEDVEAATIEGDQATFSIEIAGGQHAELRVTLDDDSKVIAAEVRRYEDGFDSSTYTRQARMQQKLGETVTKIVEGTTGPRLVGASSFEINTSKIESHDPDGHEGCDC